MDLVNIVQDVKFELGLESNDTNHDLQIERLIEKAKIHITAYCHNPSINFSEAKELEDVIVYIVSMRMNPDTKFGNSAGKQNDGGGVNTTYLNDFPPFIKDILKAHKKNPKVKFK